MKRTSLISILVALVLARHRAETYLPREQVAFRIASVALLFAIVMTLPLRAEPSAQPGQIYRDYLWRPHGNMHVVSRNQKPITLATNVDLEHATAAQLILELSNQHLGYGEIAIRMNDGPWRPVRFPERVPEPHALYFCHWNPAIDIPLAELASQTSHRFEMRVGEQLAGGNNWHQPWNPLYSVTLRITYDPVRKPYSALWVTQPKANDRLTERVVLVADRPQRGWVNQKLPASISWAVIVMWTTKATAPSMAGTVG